MDDGRAYYNEIDPDALAVLRQCIADGVIATGEVDTRSIKEVQADDLRGFTQCHFFAGGGLWSVAARMAGWPDSRPLWTGSCPCQPFSAAGKGAGTDDPRHLWPDLFRLVRDASAAGFGPAVLMGEQVSGAAGYAWFDGVRADLASEGFASRTRDIPACAVDAPHQRNRLYWVAVDDACRDRDRQPEGQVRARRLSVDAPDASQLVDASRLGRGEGRPEYELYGGRATAAGADASGGLANGPGFGRQVPVARRQPAIEWAFGGTHQDGAGTAGDVGDYQSGGRPGAGERQAHHGEAWRGEPRGSIGRNGSAWADADWIVCHDGKARRAKSGLRLLVDGLPGRVGLWRVGGNAISPVLAAEVIGAFLDAEGMREAA